MTRAAAWLAAVLLAAPAQAQPGPDDGPDLILTGTGGPDWLVACEGSTIHGERLAGAVGGPLRAAAPSKRFGRVGFLACTIEAGSAPLVLRVDKAGGQDFCPLTGRADPGECITRFGPGEAASFVFEAVP